MTTVITRNGFSSVGYATFAAGTSLSAAIAMLDTRPVAFLIPGNINDATVMTFQGSYDDVTYANIYDSEGTELTYTVAINRWVVADPTDFAGCPYFKVRLGTSSSAVEQSAKTIAVIAQAL
jgi:hypothetical protein